MLLDPYQLGSGVGRAEALPGQMVKHFWITDRADPFRLGRGALVGPNNGPAQRFTLPIHQQGTLHGSAETYGCNRSRLDARLGKQAAGGLPDGSLPIRRILFGPGGLGVERGIGFISRSKCHSLFSIKDGGLIPGRSEIVCKQVVMGHVRNKSKTNQAECANRSNSSTGESSRDSDFSLASPARPGATSRPAWV